MPVLLRHKILVIPVFDTFVVQIGSMFVVTVAVMVALYVVVVVDFVDGVVGRQLMGVTMMMVLLPWNALFDVSMMMMMMMMMTMMEIMVVHTTMIREVDVDGTWLVP
jgi:hypothetical protein